MRKRLEFECKELQQYEELIGEASRGLIGKIILTESPIQEGDDVQAYIYSAGKVKYSWVRVVKIEIKAVSMFRGHTGRLSFSYAGVPLTKEMNLMKNRNPIAFDRFIKDLIRYDVLSCDCVGITAAKMYQD